MNKSVSVKSPWDEKFMREQPFMAFGSMMNAFGQCNKGKGVDLASFEIACNKIFKLAQQYTKDAYDSVTKTNGSVEIPVKEE